MLDREFKAMTIRILTGLEKRVEDMSETLNTKIRNNIAEIKDSKKKKEREKYTGWNEQQDGRSRGMI